MNRTTRVRCVAIWVVVAAASILWGAGARADVGASDAGSPDAKETEDALADVGSAVGLRIKATEVRNYNLPRNFPITGRIVDSRPDGTTLLANTTGEKEDSKCTVVVVSGDAARAFPYTHGKKGTACVGVLPREGGGFFLRGRRATAKEGEVAGFSAEVGPQGNERWFAHDAETAESDDFKGTYVRPHSPMAYSAASDYLLTFTIGKLTIGNIDEKATTHVSVLRDGEMRVPAKTIGRTAGFGIVGGVTVLDESGDFLLYIYNPGSRGANFFTYDGRERVDKFEPAGETWNDRFVRRMIHGPDSNLYFLWTDTPEGDGATRVTVSTPDEREVWSKEYAPAPDVGARQVSLGPPVNMWVGSKYVVILYQSTEAFLRVLDAQTGEEVGVAPLEGATEMQPLNILGGRGGRLRLLTLGQNGDRLHEFRLGFTLAPLGGGDAGYGDATVPDVGLEQVASEAAKRVNSACGCSASTGSRRGVPLVPALLVLIVAGERTRRRSYR